MRLSWKEWLGLILGTAAIIFLLLRVTPRGVGNPPQGCYSGEVGIVCPRM